MNRFVNPLALAAFLVFPIMGCGDDSGNNTDENQEEEAEFLSSEQEESSSESKISVSSTSSSSMYDVKGGEFFNSSAVVSSSSVELMTFMDTRDGNVYKAVVIGEGDSMQTWMAENLKYEIPPGTYSVCYTASQYSNADSACARYGRLYT